MCDTWTRRGVILSGLALAGCQTTTGDLSATRVLTSDYDGNYEIVVSRLWTETSENLRDPNYQTEPETLARLGTSVSNGQFALLRVTNESAVGYENFEAIFLAGGVLELNTNVGYLKGADKTDSFYLRISANIGERLLGGERVVLQPTSDFSANYRPHISIRKL